MEQKVCMEVTLPFAALTLIILSQEILNSMLAFTKKTKQGYPFEIVNYLGISFYHVIGEN